VNLRCVSTHFQTPVLAIFGSKTRHARVAVCCSMLQCVAVRSSVLQCVAVCCGEIEARVHSFSHVSPILLFNSHIQSQADRVAVCCSVLQCAVVCCSVVQYVAVCCSVLQCVGISSSVASRLSNTAIGACPCISVAVCCSVMQCVAVYCSIAFSSKQTNKQTKKQTNF